MQSYPDLLVGVFFVWRLTIQSCNRFSKIIQSIELSAIVAAIHLASYVVTPLVLPVLFPKSTGFIPVALPPVFLLRFC